MFLAIFLAVHSVHHHQGLALPGAVPFTRCIIFPVAVFGHQFQRVSHVSIFRVPDLAVGGGGGGVEYLILATYLSYVSESCGRIKNGKVTLGDELTTIIDHI